MLNSNMDMLDLENLKMMQIAIAKAHILSSQGKIPGRLESDSISSIPGDLLPKRNLHTRCLSPVCAAITEYLRLVNFKRKKINWVTVLKSGKSKPKCQQVCCLVRSSLCFQDSILNAESSHGRRQRVKQDKLPL